MTPSTSPGGRVEIAPLVYRSVATRCDRRHHRSLGGKCWISELDGHAPAVAAHQQQQPGRQTFDQPIFQPSFVLHRVSVVPRFAVRFGTVLSYCTIRQAMPCHGASRPPGGDGPAYARPRIAPDLRGTGNELWLIQ
jgi:hypothetical protein